MTPLLKVKSISKSYLHEGRRVVALQDISLSINRKDVFGIVGRSGAGKSTLIRCLARLVKPTSGQIVFDGSDLAELGERELRPFRKKIGMIFQHFNLLSSRTVAGNIAYPLEIAGAERREESVTELLRLVGLEEKRNAYPASLSGGQKQRVGIARALANRPELLLCDEATSALDPQTTREILSLLKNIHQKLGVTIVLITHEMDVIKEICNKVAVLEKGQIVEEGLVTDIFADPAHPTTKSFLLRAVHQIPAEFFLPPSKNRKLLRLRFKGKPASEATISDMVKKFNVSANIIVGWLDHLQTLILGTLFIELSGTPENIGASIQFLQEKGVRVDEVHNNEL